MKTIFARTSTLIRLIGILIGLGLLWFGRSYGLGFIAGLIVSEIYLSVLNGYMAHAMKRQEYSWKSGTLVFVFRNFLLIIPFILTLLLPAYINVFAAVSGLIYFKICIYIKYLFFPDKD